MTNEKVNFEKLNCLLNIDERIKEFVKQINCKEDITINNAEKFKLLVENDVLYVYYLEIKLQRGSKIKPLSKLNSNLLIHLNYDLTSLSRSLYDHIIKSEFNDNVYKMKITKVFYDKAMYAIQDLP